MDSSGSLRKDYQKEKDFLKLLSASFDLELAARAGVVTFSFHAEHSIKLDQYADLRSFAQAGSFLLNQNMLPRSSGRPCFSSDHQNICSGWIRKFFEFSR